MFQTCAIDGRWASDIFGCSEHDDGIGWARLVEAGLMHHLRGNYQQQGDDGQHEKPDDPRITRRLRPAGARGDYSWPSNSAICSEGIAPCRSSRQPSSLVRSTMVEGMSRGDWPPSTMRGR